MIRHIVAIDTKRGFSKNGALPWDLPTDKKYYRAEIQKHGGVLLMGRKTLEVVGSWIENHKCFVLTRNRDYRTDKATVIHDIEGFLNEHKDIWVIGGEEVYDLTLARADELYITEIDADFNCDRFYPEFADKFELAHQGEDIIENDLTFRFKVYKPRRT